MAFVPFSDGIEVVLEFRVGGQAMKNVLNFVNDVNPTIPILEALGKAIIDAVLGSTWWGSILSDAVSFEDVKLTSLVSDTAPSVVQNEGTSVTLPATAPNPDPAAPNNVALVVTERTNSRGRSNRGRNYLGGIKNTTLVSSVEASSTAVTDALALFNAIHVAALALNAVPAVFSRQHDSVHLTTGVATPITSIACNPALDSQRRRLEGRGS